MTEKLVTCQQGLAFYRIATFRPPPDGRKSIYIPDTAWYNTGKFATGGVYRAFREIFFDRGIHLEGHAVFCHAGVPGQCIPAAL
jgi:hypothetical protein